MSQGILSPEPLIALKARHQSGALLTCWRKLIHPEKPAPAALSALRNRGDFVLDACLTFLMYSTVVRSACSIKVHATRAFKQSTRYIFKGFRAER